MREGAGSLTAERVAARRAVHQLLDAPLVFSDPLALRILKPEVAERIREDPKHLDRSPVSSYLRAFLVVRSRIAHVVFSWLGVVPYLELPAIEATLGSVARYSSSIVFDYGVSAGALNFADRDDGLRVGRGGRIVKATVS